MTRILGLSGGHDANWSIVDDQGIVGAFEKERFTRIRHDSGAVVQLACEALPKLGLSPVDIDLIATSEPVFENTHPGYRLLAGSKYRKPDRWEHQVVEVFGRIYPCVSIPHHLCHAAYAFYTSGFSDCVAVTLDGGGDFYTEAAYTSATVSVWENHRLKYLEAVPNVDFGSLWHTYARAIFGNGDHAGKLMGLAAYGVGELTSAFHDRFTAPVQGVFSGCRVVKNCWPDYYDPPFMQGCDSWRSQQAREIARAVEDLTLTGGLDFLATVKRATGQEKLVLSGGVALNGYLTTAIKTSSLYADMHVPPAVHDGGISLGAALFCLHHVLETEPVVASLPNLATIGHAYEVTEPFVSQLPDGAVRLEDERGAELCAARLAEGAVVAVYCGRAEHGPRALGNRSLLAAANVPDIRNRINRTIKFREDFRPVAPVVRDVRAAEFFDISWASPYMMYIVDCTNKMRNTAAEACHVDGTSRVQVVQEGSFLYDVLRAYESLGAGSVLINTSLNVREPIVEMPDQALRVYQDMPIDALWLGGWWMEKPRTAAC